MKKITLKNKKKIIQVISFGLVVLFSIYNSIIVLSASGYPSINGEVVIGQPNDTVNVGIDLSDNPGIVSATIRVNYDSKVLTLTKVTDGGLLGVQSHKPEKTSPYTLVWVNDTATKNFSSNGTIATLSFKVSKAAIYGKSYPITISYNYENYDIYDKDLRIKKFLTIDGAVKITKNHSLVIGDVNQDKKVTIDDSQSIQEVIARLLSSESIENVTADVDEDGYTSIIDVTLIQRYLSNNYVPYPIGKLIEK